MKTIDSIAELETLYDKAVPLSLQKVVTRLTPSYQTWINAARFCVLTTVGPGGTDGSPRGDEGPVVRIIDDKTLHVPDWRGNNRIDSLRNIVNDGRVSLLFMVPGHGNVVRINGTAKLTADPDVTRTFTQKGRNPKCVIVITMNEAYFQCAKAVMRSDLWGVHSGENLPKAGEFLQEQVAEFDGKTYDDNYAEYAKTRMW